MHTYKSFICRRLSMSYIFIVIYYVVLSLNIKSFVHLCICRRFSTSVAYCMIIVFIVFVIIDAFAGLSRCLWVE